MAGGREAQCWHPRSGPRVDRGQMLLGTCRRSWPTLREGPPGARTRGQAAASADVSEQAFEGGLLDARLAGPPPDGRILLRVVPGSMVTLAVYPLSQNSAAEPSMCQRQRPRARAQLKVPYEAAIELSSQGSAPRHQVRTCRPLAKESAPVTCSLQEQLPRRHQPHSEQGGLAP